MACFLGEDHLLELDEGRTIGYAMWGDPDGTPVFFVHFMPGSRRDRYPGLDAILSGLASSTYFSSGSTGPATATLTPGRRPACSIARGTSCCDGRRWHRGGASLRDAETSHERFPVPGGEAGHNGSLRVELMFEEDGEVAPPYVPQQYVACQWSPYASGHAIVSAGR